MENKVELEQVHNWLRKEAEDINEKIDKLEVKRRKIIENTDMNSINRINQFTIEVRELQAIQNKLYELIGRCDNELG